MLKVSVLTLIVVFVLLLLTVTSSASTTCKPGKACGQMFIVAEELPGEYVNVLLDNSLSVSVYQFDPVVIFTYKLYMCVCKEGDPERMDDDVCEGKTLTCTDYDYDPDYPIIDTTWDAGCEFANREAGEAPSGCQREEDVPSCAQYTAGQGNSGTQTP